MPSDGSAPVAVVVEDDDSLREMLCELLEMDGFRAMGCRDGREGLTAVRQFHPSVLTLDLHMPGMDGEEVLVQLASDESTAGVPVVVVSAYATDRRPRFTGQVKAVIPKPFDVAELWEHVRRAANGHT